MKALLGCNHKLCLDVGKAESDKKIEAWQEKVTTSNAQRTLIPYSKSREQMIDIDFDQHR